MAVTLGIRLAVKLALLVLLAALAVWAARNAKAMKAVVRRYFQEEGSPCDLALFRIVLFATLFLTADPALIQRYASLPHELSVAPLGFGTMLRILPVDPTLARVLALALRAACLLAAIGLFTRSASAIAGLLAFYVIGITQIYGQVDHYHFLVWFPILLALSPCGDAFSLDALWRRLRRGRVAPVASVAYARPIRWVWLLMGVMYFFPGIWKLWISGPDWLFGDALISHMRRKWAELHWVPALRPDHHRWLLRAAGVGAIAFEISFLPLVFFRRARRFLAVAGLAFHNLSTLLMGISFIRLQAMYASFLRVERLMPRGFARRPTDAAAPDRPVRTWPLDAAGGLFLAACLLMGALLIERAWPFACFPTFAFVARPTATELEFVAISESGDATPIDAWPIIRSMGTERWGPMARRAETSTASLAALARWVASRVPESKDAVRIAVYRLAWSTNPDRRAQEPARRELLADVPRSK